MSKHRGNTPPANSRPDSLTTNATLADSTESDAGANQAMEDPKAKGDGPLPEEVTGRASATQEDLVTLMANDSGEHITDGFRAGNGDDPESDVDTDDDADDDLN
jgi:hypothetical protein